MTALRNLSVIDPPFLVGLGAVTALVFIVSWFRLPRWWMRWSVRVGGIVLAVTMVAAAVNARYAYLPTVAALVGRSATDQVSPAQLRQLELAGGGALGGGGRSVGARLALSRGSDRGATLNHGVVVKFHIPATKSHFRARTAEVYLPPAYFDTPRPQLPVIELLHGTPGAVVDWTRGGLVDVTVDAYASQHGGVAPVLVMPDVNGSWNADTECVNGKRGQVQTYLTEDVRAAVISAFHTRSDAGGWAIEGYSEGAYCALQIGLRNPKLYGAIGDFSGEAGPSTGGGVQQLFAGSLQQAEHQAVQYEPAVLLTRWDSATRPVIWFEVGSNDPTLRTMVNLDILARAHGFETRFVEQQGADHSFASWRDAFRERAPLDCIVVRHSRSRVSAFDQLAPHGIERPEDGSTPLGLAERSCHRDALHDCVGDAFVPVGVRVVSVARKQARVVPVVVGATEGAPEVDVDAAIDERDGVDHVAERLREGVPGGDVGGASGLCVSAAEPDHRFDAPAPRVTHLRAEYRFHQSRARTSYRHPQVTSAAPECYDARVAWLRSLARPSIRNLTQRRAFGSKVIGSCDAHERCSRRLS